LYYEGGMKGMKMPEIKFLDEYDKLKPDRFRVGEVFVELRGYEAKKEIFYLEHIGKCFDVILLDGEHRKKIGEADLIGMTIKRPSDISIKLLKFYTNKYYSIGDITSIFETFYSNPNPLCFYLIFRINKVSNCRKNCIKEECE